MTVVDEPTIVDFSALQRLIDAYESLMDALGEFQAAAIGAGEAGELSTEEIGELRWLCQDAAGLHFRLASARITVEETTDGADAN